MFPKSVLAKLGRAMVESAAEVLQTPTKAGPTASGLDRRTAAAAASCVAFVGTCCRKAAVGRKTRQIILHRAKRAAHTWRPGRQGFSTVKRVTDEAIAQALLDHSAPSGEVCGHLQRPARYLHGNKLMLWRRGVRACLGLSYRSFARRTARGRLGFKVPALTPSFFSLIGSNAGGARAGLIMLIFVFGVRSRSTTHAPTCAEER